MWDGVWPALSGAFDVVRLDLRGFGESTTRPTGTWSPRADVLAVLADLGIERGHLIGCSLGAGVCAELAVEHPELVASLLLVSPAGSLVTERTEDLARFVDAENAALSRGDLDAATEANLVAWVDGARRRPGEVAPAIREAVRLMQRRAFEIAADWPDDVWEAEEGLEPELVDRLGEISAPTLVLHGDLDLDAIRAAADVLVRQVPHVRRIAWPDTAHLATMERPDDFVQLVRDWIPTIGSA